MGRYGIKEVFRTIQGEGARAGTSAVFVRFTGCNLWDGHHLHRAEGAGPCARWCDTDFFKGVAMGTDDLLGLMQQEWSAEPDAERWCVLTGGEPALQLDAELVVALNEAGWSIAVETNGTVDNAHLAACQHVCVSPKYDTPWVNALRHAHEVKVILPGAMPGEQGWTDATLLNVEAMVPDAALFVQPQDPVLPGPDLTSLLKGGLEENEQEILSAIFEASVKKCVAWVHKNPAWRLSLQGHKWVGLE